MFVRRCVWNGRQRIGTVESLRAEACAWAATRNAARGTVDRQMTTADARVKLKRYYPRVNP